MEIVFDNDALWFLVATDLLTEFLQAIEVDSDACCRLPTSIFMLQGRTLKKLQKQFLHVDWTQLHVLQRITQIPELSREAQNRKLIDVLSAVEGLDEGEVALIEVIAECDCRMVTGDMRALSALSKVAADLKLKKRLDFKIITLCRVLEVLLGSVERAILQERFTSAGVVHRTVQVVFGSEFGASQSEVEEALKSYLGYQKSNHVFALWDG